jgi:hypothetical protein
MELGKGTVSKRKSPQSAGLWTEDFGRLVAERLGRFPETDPPAVLPAERPRLARSLTRNISQRIAKKLTQMTPMELMNWSHPDLRLHSLPFPDREFFGEPDVDVCLRYFRRVLAAGQSEDDEVVSVLLEFLEKHPIEFTCSGWVIPAVGYVVLGYPRLRTCAPRAKKLFSAYWRRVNSPLPEKCVGHFFPMFQGNRFLDSQHADHWRAVVRWMEKKQRQDIVAGKWFAEYAKSHPHRCTCVHHETFKLIRKAYAKVAKRLVDLSPAPSVVILEAVATKCGVSSSKLGKYCADTKKKIRKK